MAENRNVSAGLLLFRRPARGLELFLAHPGGPFWRGRDLGAWTIPKGLVAPGEPFVLVGEALRITGYSVSTAADGPEAVEAMERERFDVVVSDVSMPKGMSGIELSGHAARLQPHARVILASGFARAQLPVLPSNVIFLPKPYRISDLGQRLERLLKQVARPVA